MLPKFVLGENVDKVFFYMGFAAGMLLSPFIIVAASTLCIVRGAWRITMRRLSE